MVECITNRLGYSMLVTPVEVYTSAVEPFIVRAIVDTGASVSMLSPALIQRLRAPAKHRIMMVHGSSGKKPHPMVGFGLRVPGYENDDCTGIALTNAVAGHDLVLGLDVLLATGLTLTPGGKHRLESQNV
jgi:hypothetical protein